MSTIIKCAQTITKLKHPKCLKSGNKALTKVRHEMFSDQQTAMPRNQQSNETANH